MIRLLVGLALSLASVANAYYSTVTVASTTTYVYPTPTVTPTPTRTTSRGGTTSCVPATTKVIYSLCNEGCLAKSTSTSTFTTYPPPVTATIPCGVKYPKRVGGEEQELEKRATCAPGPTITTTSNLACTACKRYPHSTVVTSSVVRTVYETCAPFTSRPTPTTTSPSLSTITPPPWASYTSGMIVPTFSFYCFWVCTNSATRTTIYHSATVATNGWDRCVQACT